MISSKKNPEFLAGVAFSLMGLITNFIAFASPYWLQSKPGTQSLFKNIGLWTSCFDGYMVPEHYNEAYFAWLYGIQALFSSGLLVLSISVFFILCQQCDTIVWNRLRYLKLHILAYFFTCLTIIGSIVAWTVASYDSRWMPYPEDNMLSWSYGFAIISLLFLICAMISLIVLFLKLEPHKDDSEHIDNQGNTLADDLDMDPNAMEMYPKYPKESFRANERFGNNSVRDPLLIGSPDLSNEPTDRIYLGKPPSELNI